MAQTKLREAQLNILEYLQDSVGGMVSGNIESGISVTYDDAGGKLDFVVNISDQIREKLTANRTYYVRTDGSDSNSGLANNSGSAFLTLQKAWDTIQTLDLRGFDATIKLGNTGTFTAGITANVPPVGGSVIIEGDTSTPSNTVVSVTSGNCFTFNVPVNVTIKHLKMATSTSGFCIFAGYAAKVTINAVDFGACASSHIRALYGGIVIAGGNYSITGGAANHYEAGVGGKLAMGGVTITLTGTPAFSTAFTNATTTGVISCFSLVFSGSATGVRYTVTLNAAVNTFGGGANFFPGNSAGSTATGGQYA